MHDVNDYKMVVIRNGEEDGWIYFFGDAREYRFHVDALRDYLYTYYDKLAEEINADDIKDNRQLIIYLNDMGHIVYLHSPGFGLLFMPKAISEEQKKSLYNLFDSFEKTPIHIDYNLTRKDDGIFPEENVNYINDNENVETLDKFFSGRCYVKR